MKKFYLAAGLIAYSLFLGACSRDTEEVGTLNGADSPQVELFLITESHPPSAHANGGRDTFRFDYPGEYYTRHGKAVVSFGGVIEFDVTDGGSRHEPGSGMVWKPVSDNTGKLAVVGKYNVYNSDCTVEYMEEKR